MEAVARHVGLLRATASKLGQGCILVQRRCETPIVNVRPGRVEGVLDYKPMVARGKIGGLLGAGTAEKACALHYIYTAAVLAWSYMDTLRLKLVHEVLCTTSSQCVTLQ